MANEKDRCPFIKCKHLLLSKKWYFYIPKILPKLVNIL